MNPRFKLLKPYPFEQYRKILDGVVGDPAHRYIDLSIGEPKHPTPDLIRSALADNLDGLGNYPPTAGSPALREAIANWLNRRFAPARLSPDTDVLPVLGSREALFALTQTIVDPYGQSVVVSPNPFYQIYEGAALLAGASMHYVAQTPGGAHTCDWRSIPTSIWKRTALVFVCTPGNPTGSIISSDEWAYLFELRDKYGFVIASDECYSELYPPDSEPPIGCLQANAQLGRSNEGLIAFGSLSKRSNAPGMRSGYVAGDSAIIKAFLQYRTYHGSAMSPPIQLASIAAWNDEAHVEANRALYDEKYRSVVPILTPVLELERPQAGFYLWAGVPGGDDIAFSVDLFRQYNVRVLPGSLLGREIDGINPGSGKIRIALVAALKDCNEACERIVEFCLATAN